MTLLWSNLAAAQGRTDTSKSCDTVALNMTRDQIATARQMVWVWKQCANGLASTKNRTLQKSSIRGGNPLKIT